MIFRLLRIALALTIALVGGTWLAWLSLREPFRFDPVVLDGWTAYPLAGTVDADPFSKSRLSRDAGITLGAAEGVVFRTRSDSDGNGLLANCNYVIEGRAPPARFWTLHAEDEFGIAGRTLDKGLPESLHSGNLIYQQDGAMVISVSRNARPNNWLAISLPSSFTLVMTLYDSPVAANKGLIETKFPIVRKIACDD